ncbi:MAG TPA: nucleotidyltransferase family protein [Candidatus Binataceae bacterium]|nr:nucleotidyltransferase family protein [Candidatus Binataceae bacterium]
MKAFSAEARLILACCAGALRAEPGDADLGPASDLDWRRVIDLAHVEGVLPSVHRCLANNPSGRVPETAMRELRFHFEDFALRNRLLTRELARLTAILETNGLSPIAYKGPILALTAYGDVAMRQFSDLDLLVPRAEMASVVRLLGADGYQPESSNSEIVTDDFFQASKDEFVKLGSKHVIDLHWELMPRYFPFAPDPEHVRRRAVRLRHAEGEFAAPALHDQMLIACVHGTRHGWPYLETIADVAALLRIENGYDWPALYDEAAALGSLPMLLLGMTLAHQALAAPIPQTALEMAQRDPIVAALAPRILEALFSYRVGAGVSLFYDWEVPLRAIGRRRAQAIYILDRTFTPTFDDWRFAPLPRPLFPLYYLVRPLRLLIQQTPRLTSALGRSFGHEARP